MLLLYHHIGTPDAVGAAGKAVEVEWSRLIASIHTVEVRAEIDPPKRSPTVDFRMVLVLRSEKLAGTAYMGV